MRLIKVNVTLALATLGVLAEAAQAQQQQQPRFTANMTSETTRSLLKNHF